MICKAFHLIQDYVGIVSGNKFLLFVTTVSICSMTILLFLKGQLDTCYELFVFSQLWCGRAFICYTYPHPSSRNRNLTGLPLIISLFPCEDRIVYCFMHTLKPSHAFSRFQGNSRQQNKVENFVSSESSGTKDALHCCSRPDECIHRISYIRVHRTFLRSWPLLTGVKVA